MPPRRSTTRIRKEALAAIDELKAKGPNSKRDVSFWGKVGEGTLAVGCIAAAATGQVEVALPCVIGGAASSAALQTWDYINKGRPGLEPDPSKLRVWSCPGSSPGHALAAQSASGSGRSWKCTTLLVVPLPPSM